MVVIYWHFRDRENATQIVVFVSAVYRLVFLIKLIYTVTQNWARDNFLESPDKFNATTLPYRIQQQGNKE